MVQNKSVVFLDYPTEYPVEGEHLAVQTKELNAELKPNDVLLRNLYISLDPCKSLSSSSQPKTNCWRYLHERG